MLHSICICILLFRASIMHKNAQNNWSDGGLDAALESTLHGGLNVVLEGVP